MRQIPVLTGSVPRDLPEACCSAAAGHLIRNRTNGPSTGRRDECRKTNKWFSQNKCPPIEFRPDIRSILVPSSFAYSHCHTSNQFSGAPTQLGFQVGQEAEQMMKISCGEVMQLY
ncbi:hypothetical protein E4T56_gene13241 [Termitomyces sp. T112]|nr:hypothetical protein E4T56_gene13241 [Termitomyces sp. T112]